MKRFEEVLTLRVTGGVERAATATVSAAYRTLPTELSASDQPTDGCTQTVRWWVVGGRGCRYGRSSDFLPSTNRLGKNRIGVGMITMCWAAKGGSGTSVVAASLALASPTAVLLVDLAGDSPAVLGIADSTGPGAHDWLRSEADSERLRALEVEAASGLSLLPSGRPDASKGSRWSALAEHFAAEERDVVIDAGTCDPPRELHNVAHRSWLVTRPCYLSLRAAVRQKSRATGVVLIEEPGRSLNATDVAVALGVPVVATILFDPAIARAVDAGLLAARVPSVLHRRLREAA
jgi:hypothetical protein